MTSSGSAGLCASGCSSVSHPLPAVPLCLAGCAPGTSACRRSAESVAGDWRWGVVFSEPTTCNPELGVVAGVTSFQADLAHRKHESCKMQNRVRCVRPCSSKRDGGNGCIEYLRALCTFPSVGNQLVPSFLRPADVQSSWGGATLLIAAYRWGWFPSFLNPSPFLLPHAPHGEIGHVPPSVITSVISSISGCY